LGHKNTGHPVGMIRQFGRMDWGFRGACHWGLGEWLYESSAC